MAQDPALSLSEVRNKFLLSLTQTSVSSIKYAQPIVLDSKTEPKKAIEILLEKKIRAAPVIENNQFIGVLDLRDTVKYVLESYKKGTIDTMKAKAMEYLTASPQITTQSLRYLAKMRPFKCCTISDNLLVVSKYLAKGQHIVGVLNNEKNKLIGIITQGMMFQQIAKQWSHINSNITLLEMSNNKYVTTKNIKTIASNAKAYDAFELMSKCDLSGLAVVDNNGKIIHNTSATDIKLWLIASSTLEESIEQFLINIRKLSVVEKYPITVCSFNDTLKRAIGKLQATQYHRLWIVDDAGRPVGVFALTDVFRFIVEDHLKKDAEEQSKQSQLKQSAQSSQPSQQKPSQPTQQPTQSQQKKAKEVEQKEQKYKYI